MEAIGESLKSWEEIPDQDGKSYEANLDGWRAFCRDEWMKCQQAILRSLGDSNEAIYPWDVTGNLKNILLPPPLNFRSPSDQGSSSMFEMSWHQENFKLNKEYYIPSLFPKGEPGVSNPKGLLETRAKSICKIEIFPYQSLGSKDITEYIKKPAHYLPSQKLLIRYIATAISTAERDRRIIIFRNTVTKNAEYLDEILRNAKQLKTAPEILNRQLFKQTNTKSHLTFQNLQHIDAGEHYKNLIRSYTC